MFHIINEVKKRATNDMFQELDRTYNTVLGFEVQDALNGDPEFGLYGVCEADEAYIVAVSECAQACTQKGRAQNIRVRQTAGRDTCLSL